MSDSHSTKKNIMIIAGAALLLLVCICLGLAFGSVRVSLADFVKDTINSRTDSAVYRIIRYVRLPRVVAAMLSGMALAVSGVIIQAVLNNSLAAPNIIGVNAGAGFMTLLIMGAFPGLYRLAPAASVIGALLTSIFIFTLAARTGASRITITLAGIAVSSLLTAGMNTIKTFFPDTMYNANAFLIGGFSGVSFQNIGFSWIPIIFGILVAFILAKDIDVLMLGENTAKSLGMNVTLLRFVLLVIASLLAGCAVSFSGLLGFVGLIVPHMVRILVGNSHRLVIPVSVLGGGSFVLICDIISRTAFSPYEIPVGIILSLLGAPFFLFLILRRKRGALR